ncbi:hypothetical protein BT63DRAFT_425739 [Microthyrium microscopicum]|uniref:Uncharacterized protein n=1 Tax=Microthyrium microscopicum TaxID=703497 RepID=A0A6A6U821_9PEZI|nr:hypothetical protein BT63DRAFT_425739 [Microthyrium microscopicum]
MPPRRARISEPAVSAEPATAKIAAPKRASAKALHDVTTDKYSEAVVPSQIKDLSKTWRWALLPVVSMAISALLYTLADPFVDRQLPAVSSEPELWRELAPLGEKFVLLWTLWGLKLDATNAFTVTTLIRIPFYFLLYLFYNISLPTVIFSTTIDATSVAIAFLLMGRRRARGYASKAASESPEAHALYDPTNTVLAMLFATGIYALSLYALSTTVLPTLVVRHFYPIPSVERAHNASLYSLALPCLPLGWSIRELLYGPPTSADKLPLGLPVSTRTATKLRRALVLVTLVFLETYARTFTAIGGSTLTGAGIWASIWAATTLAASLALAYVGAAADPEVDGQLEEKVVGEKVVGKKTSASRKSPGKA